MPRPSAQVMNWSMRPCAQSVSPSSPVTIGTEAASVAGFHVYDASRSNCSDISCWSGAPATLAASVPIVTGELGETDCAHGLIDSFMSWADGLGISYLGWAWNPQDCKMFPALVTDTNGTPSGFGQGLHDHLIQIN